MKRALLLLSLFLFTTQSFGQTKIKAMFYNLLNYSNSVISQNKTLFLGTILQEVNPDLFMVCELINQQGSDYLFNNAILSYNSDFQEATYQTNQSSGVELQQMVYYNAKKLILEISRVITADTRDINHYTFKINTENISTNPIRLEVFVTHLKASTGTSNRLRRLASIENFVTALNDIPSTSYVLFAGDFNFYTSNEEGYQKLIDNTNPIVMVDPINRSNIAFPNDGTDYFDPNNYNVTYFWRSNTFADIHTQSTRINNTGLIDTSGSTGGLDDRFDFIMMSQNFHSSPDLFYVDNSYRSIGNNGNCYNSFINNTSCNGTYSQNLRNALIEFSDHLPIVMEIESPQNTLSTVTYTLPVSFSTSNIAESRLELSLHHDHTIKRLQIYNIKGQLVKSLDIKNSINESLSINVEELSNGIYYLTAQNLSTPLKFVKI